MEPPRRSSSASMCDLHPHDEGFAGSFCPSCLRDRLSLIDASPSSSSSFLPGQGRRSTSSLFPPPPPPPNVNININSNNNSNSNSNSNRPFNVPTKISATAAAAPADADLRRCKSFSARSHSHSHSSFTIGERENQVQQALSPSPSPSQSLNPMKMKIHLDLHSPHSNSQSNFFLRKWHQWRSNTRKPRNPPPQPQRPQPQANHPCSFDYPSRPRFSYDSSLSLSHSSTTNCHHPCFSTLNLRSDHQIPLQVEEEDQEDNSAAFPGSQAQTRDYYLDSSTSARHRRRSFERSANSMCKPPDIAFNSKVSPAGPAELYHYHPPPHPLASHALPPDTKPKGKPKKWSLWGLIHRKANSKDQSPNANQFLRCSSSISARTSYSSSSYINVNANAAPTIRRNSVDINGYSKKRRDDFLLERNHSARYSPDRLDNAMLRFYLTGSQSGRRNTYTGVRPVNGAASQSLSVRPPHQFY